MPRRRSKLFAWCHSLEVHSCRSPPYVIFYPKSICYCSLRLWRWTAKKMWREKVGNLTRSRWHQCLHELPTASAEAHKLQPAKNLLNRIIFQSNQSRLKVLIRPAAVEITTLLLYHSAEFLQAKRWSNFSMPLEKCASYSPMARFIAEIIYIAIHPNAQVVPGCWEKR